MSPLFLIESAAMQAPSGPHQSLTSIPSIPESGARDCQAVEELPAATQAEGNSHYYHFIKMLWHVIYRELTGCGFMHVLSSQVLNFQSFKCQLLPSPRVSMIVVSCHGDYVQNTSICPVQ